MTTPGLRLQAARTLAVDLVTAECSRALSAAGVPHLLLKGPVLARWLYADGSPRPYGDSDLLVPAEQHRRAGAVLEGLGFRDLQAGFRASERVRHATPYRRGAATVDLHHTLGLLAGGPPVWPVLARETEPLEVAGVRVATLAPAARCLALALHAAQHGRAEAKPLEDLVRGLATAPASVWEAAGALADELDCRPAFAFGVALGSDPSFGPGHPVWEAAPVDARLAGLLGTGARTWARTAERGARGGRPALVAAAASRLAPSRALLRSRYDVRDRWGLVAAYARYVAHAARAAPGARRLARGR